jgi:hypothetical protein
MSHAVIGLLALVSALLQVSVLPALIPTAAAPLLPIAVLAAWSAMRGSATAWPALISVAATLGVASDQRVAWFLLALLPTAALAMAFAAPESRVAEVRRPLHAAGVAAAGGAAYLATLLVAAGEARALPDAAPDIIAAATGTGVVAVLFAAALWPVRTRPARFVG